MGLYINEIFNIVLNQYKIMGTLIFYWSIQTKIEIELKKRSAQQGVMERAACCRPRKRQPSTSTVDFDQLKKAGCTVQLVDVDQIRKMYF